jgi:hypothetical protein
MQNMGWIFQPGYRHVPQVEHGVHPLVDMVGKAFVFKHQFTGDAMLVGKYDDLVIDRSF